MSRHSENRTKAQKSAEFVDVMRAEFPDLKIVRIREGDFHWGPDDEEVYATCFIVDTKKK